MPAQAQRQQRGGHPVRASACAARSPCSGVTGPTAPTVTGPRRRRRAAPARGPPPAGSRPGTSPTTAPPCTPARPRPSPACAAASSRPRGRTGPVRHTTSTCGACSRSPSSRPRSTSPASGRAGPGVPVAGQQVGQQVGAHPLVGLGGAQGEQQHQRGDHGRALDGAALALVEVVRAAEHERAQPLPGRRHGDRPDPAGLGDPAGPGRPEHRRAAGQRIRLARRRRRRGRPAAAASASSTATQQPSSSPSVAAMSSTPPPPSTTPANRSCAAAACSIAGVRRWTARPARRRLGRPAGLHQRHRGQRGQRPEQRHLVAAERAAACGWRRTAPRRTGRPPAAGCRRWRPGPPRRPRRRSRVVCRNRWSAG